MVGSRRPDKKSVTDVRIFIRAIAFANAVALNLELINNASLLPNLDHR